MCCNNLFHQMELDGILDPLNEADIHYIYIPRINKSIIEFLESWNHHSLSSARHLSPYQLFFDGMHIRERESESSHPSRSIDIDVTDDHVSVPRIKFSPCPQFLQDIGHIDPFQSCPFSVLSTK